MKLEVVKIGEYYALRKTTWFGFIKRYRTISGDSQWLSKGSLYFTLCLTDIRDHILFACAKGDEKV